MSRKYYFSSSRKKDGDGTKENPFSSLDIIQTLSLERGDEILLSSSSVFKGGYIHIKNTDGVKISSYGKGRKPIIDAFGGGIWYENYGRVLDSPVHRYRGDVSSTILIYDSNDITIDNIEVRNTLLDKSTYSDPERIDRTGIAVCAQNRGTIKNITIKNVTLKSINGNVYDKHLSNGGIYFTSIEPDSSSSPPPRFDNVIISSCFVKNTSRWGIALGYTYLWNKFTGTVIDEETFRKYGNTNIRIEDTYVKNIGGDGITVMYALSPSVAFCRADSVAMDMNDRVYLPGNRMGKVAAAIWSWKCMNALFENNEVYDTKLNQDAMAYDADSGWNTTYRHNYSHSNEGGAVMFCLEEALGSVYKENISDDDLGGILSPSGCPDGLIENNTIYRREETPIMRKTMSDGVYKYRNNKEIIIKRKI